MKTTTQKHHATCVSALLYHAMKNTTNPNSSSSPRFFLWIFTFFSIASVFYSLGYFNRPSFTGSFHQSISRTGVWLSGITNAVKISGSRVAPPYSPPPVQSPVPAPDSSSRRLQLRHLVFGIAASSELWGRRKEYIKLWWKPDQMRGVVWLDNEVRRESDMDLIPTLRISGNTSRFQYNNPTGHRSAIRISRIVSETLRLGMADVRWFVLGDDDTFFVPDNLVRVLSKYDHNQMYYIGSMSESHVQNIRFSYNMAYGGGGFAISYPLAVALERFQDRCIDRYPGLYGSDDRVHACLAELGVPLTRERGFHQFDVYGSLYGLLAAHPVTPLVSLHHLDLFNPIFPDMGQVQALRHLNGPIQLDSAALMQQSICYDKPRKWTVSVSWGYAVEILPEIHRPRDIEVPSITFRDWYDKSDSLGFAFNTQPEHNDPCKKPYVYFLSDSRYDTVRNETVTVYVRKWAPGSKCKWKQVHSKQIWSIEVYKKLDPNLWVKAPRRNCCRILPSKTKDTMEINVGPCEDNEVVEF